MKDFKGSTWNALLKFHEKQLPSDRKRKKKNSSPEKEVEKEVRAWARKFGFDLTVVDTKNVYSSDSGGYSRNMASESLSDLIGDIKGWACFIELKARGRRSTLKPHQYLFLERKIKNGCFACCVDRAAQVESLYITCKDMPLDDRIKFLLSELPKPKRLRDIDDSPLFDAEK